MKIVKNVYKIGIGVTALVYITALGMSYRTKDTDESSKRHIDLMKKHPNRYLADFIGTSITWPLFWSEIISSTRKKHSS